MLEFFPMVTLIFSAIAATAAIISIYYHLTSRPKLRILLNGEEKELIIRANEEYKSTLRLINSGNVATELFRVIIKFPSSFKLLPVPSPQIANNRPTTYIPKDLNLPSDVMEPARIIKYPEAAIRNSEVIFERRGILPWNLGGKGYFDFLIQFKAPNGYKKYNLEITVQTVSKTFIKNFILKVTKGDKG